MIEPVTTGGIIVLVISSIGSWLKIIRDTRKRDGDGVDLKDIKKTVEGTDKKVGNMSVDIGKIETEIKDHKKYCTKVTSGFEKLICENRDRIFDIKGKRK